MSNENDEWAIIKCAPDYLISKSGQIKHSKTGRLREINVEWYKNKERYTQASLQINGKSKTFFIHRLVAETFIPNPDNKPTVNHKDADKYNNHVDNLEWNDRKEQMQHVHKLKLRKSNVVNKCPILLYEMINNDKTNLKLVQEFDSIKSVAIHFNVRRGFYDNLTRGNILYSKYILKRKDITVDIPKQTFVPVIIYDEELEISKEGTVLRNGKIYKSYIRSGGYLKLTMKIDNVIRNILLHRLLAQAFIPNPENKPMVDHIDGNPLNNSIDNLRWVTASENSRNPNTIAKNIARCAKPVAQYSLDGKLIDKFTSMRDAERDLNISHTHISNVCKQKQHTAGGYIWKYI